MAGPSLVERLERLLGCEVGDLTPLTGGASRATFALETRGPGRAAGRPLILRLDRGGATPARMELEARLIEASAAAGVPVPPVVGASDDPAALGAAYMLLERIDGETIPRRILRDEAFAEARAKVLGQAAEALARIHAVDASGIGGLDDADPLGQWSDVLHGLGEPHPALEIALQWLTANRPTARAGRRFLVHGDFRMGNLIVASDGLRAVLDWELAHIGDPAEDLGWMCVRAWRFGSDLPALGLGSYEELLEAYGAAGGDRGSVDLPTLWWWETFGTFRWGVMCVLMSTTAIAAGHLTVEQAAIGRRACENEWDVLSCLERAGVSAGPDPVFDAVAQPAPSGFHDRPTAAELAGAVRGFLSEAVGAGASGRVGFDARVAANVLGMIERQLERAPADEAHHAQLMASLGVASESELAAGIRRGSILWDDPSVLAVVRWTVRAKLAVAHPGYAGGASGI